MLWWLLYGDGKVAFYISHSLPCSTYLISSLHCNPSSFKKSKSKNVVKFINLLCFSLFISPTCTLSTSPTRLSIFYFLKKFPVVLPPPLLRQPAMFQSHWLGVGLFLKHSVLLFALRTFMHIVLLLEMFSADLYFPETELCAFYF